MDFVPSGPYTVKWPLCTAGPAHDEEVRDVRDVVGVQVRDAQGVDGRHRDAAREQAPGRTPAEVDHDAVVAGDDHLAGAAAIRIGERAAGAEQQNVESSHVDLL